MSRTLHFTGISVFLCASWLSVAAQPPPSVLGEGHWAKFSTNRNGVYKIDYETLKKAGFNPEALDPRKIRLFGFPTGMLLQANSTPRPYDLSELAVQVTGQEDGKFDRGDLIIFYGQGPDLIAYEPLKNVFSYQNNLFTDKNFYFLTISAQNGKRVSKAPASGSGLPVINEFQDFSYYEVDQYNDLKSGRVWFGEQFDARLDITIRFTISGIVENSPIRIVSNLMAQSYTESTFRLFWNNVQVLDKTMATILETQYGIKGQIAADTILTNSSAVLASSETNQDIRVQYIKGSSGRSVGYLNYILLNVTRKLAMYGSPTFFAIPATPQPDSEVELTAAPSEAIAWEVTDPFETREQNSSNSNNTLRFSTPTATTKHFVAFLPSALETADFEEEVANQDLHGVIVPDLVIVTHPFFLAEAQRLAAHRENTYGIEVVTVTTNQIFNEFSGGKQDVTAIRDFMRHLYLKSPGKLKNILLFGRGSYDYKNRVFNNSNYVPTYESRNSLSPLETFSSDDYFTFLESTEGNWGESPAQDHTLDVGVGRIPVRTAIEAAQVVDKLIEYDFNPARNAGWRQEILFVADDGDFNIHQSQADQLAEDIEFNYQMYHTHKVYLDAFQQDEIASGQVSPKAKEALNSEINKGFAIVNFTGHGSEQVWMQERILDVNTPAELKNNPRMPLLVTATCEFGRYDDPLLISTAENLLFKKNGGAIGLVTTTRPVNSATNFTLNKAFYSSFFDPSTEVKDLGTIFKETKNKSVSGISNRNFSLLGDPSLRFGPPPERILVTSVKTLNDSDTLKALSTVAIEGEIQRAGIRSNDFDGTLEIAVLDKRSQLLTLGDENTPFAYQLWDHSLFRGRASVEQGQFRVEFILPVNLAAQIGNGKLVIYAFSGDKMREAMGTYTDFKVGGSEAGSAPDNTGPFIELFMGDTTFVNGGYTNTDTRLVGRLSDKSGINISGYDPTNLIATLDGSITFVVNDYFVANKDDFTRGSFSFPIDGLTEGNHTITFQAWDNHNNLSAASVDFVVGPEGKLIIEELSNYPNPFSESTTLQFTHSRSGEDLEAQIVIYDLMGQLAESREFTITSSAYRVTLFEWNGQSTTGTKMSNGLYLMKLSVRSLTDGAKNDKIAKLILVN